MSISDEYIFIPVEMARIANSLIGRDKQEFSLCFFPNSKKTMIILDTDGRLYAFNNYVLWVSPKAIISKYKEPLEVSFLTQIPADENTGFIEVAINDALKEKGSVSTASCNHGEPLIHSVGVSLKKNEENQVLLKKFKGMIHNFEEEPELKLGSVRISTLLISIFDVLRASTHSEERIHPLSLSFSEVHKPNNIKKLETSKLGSFYYSPEAGE